MAVVTVEQEGHLLLIGVNRPEANNLWNLEVIQGVIEAYTRLAEDDDLRVGVVHAYGKHFTGGLDLVSVAPAMAGGDTNAMFPEGAYDPFDFVGEPCPKPIVVAVHGACNTLGIELIMASQAAVAADDTRFAQLEVARGIVPLGGASYRLLARFGSAGMRYMLTAEKFDAQEALRLGLVAEVVPLGQQLDRACDIARMIAANAPIAVRTSLASARAAERAARDAARQVVLDANAKVLSSSDAMEGVQAMIQRRAPNFEGK